MADNLANESHSPQAADNMNVDEIENLPSVGTPTAEEPPPRLIIEKMVREYFCEATLCQLHPLASLTTPPSILALFILVGA